MSITIAAILAMLLATGMSSAISHPMTLVCGCGAALLMAGFAIIRHDARVHSTFIFGSIGMAVLGLVSAELNHCAESSTINVLCCYLALFAMAFSSPHLSGFCRQLILFTNVWLTVWIFYYGTRNETLAAWQVSSPASSGNLMAAQINMTMPLVIAGIGKGPVLQRSAFGLLLCLNMMAVVLVMSRNGIGAMLVLLTLYVMFNYKRLSVLIIAVIMFFMAYPEYIIQNPVIRPLLVKFRVIDFKPVAPRSMIWNLAWQHISEHPIWGVGPGRTAVALAGIDTNHAHNNLIQVALETGLPTACIYLFVVVALMSLPARALFSDRSSFLSTLGIVAYLAFSMTAAPLVFPNATLLLAACVNEARVNSGAARRNAAVTRGQDRRGLHGAAFPVPARMNPRMVRSPR